MRRCVSTEKHSAVSFAGSLTLRAWGYQILEHDAKLPLAPIIPLVFYHGQGRWNVSREFSDLIRRSEELNHCTPCFQYVLADLTAEAEREPGDDPILEVTLDALRYAFDRKLRTLASILTWLDAVQATLRGREALNMVRRYLSSIGVAKRELQEAARHAFPRGGATIMRGFLEEVFEEGVEQGAVATARRLLPDVLETRFGGVPESIAAQIRATQDVPALTAWHKLATMSGSIDDFATGLSKTLE